MTFHEALAEEYYDEDAHMAVFGDDIEAVTRERFGARAITLLFDRHAAGRRLCLCRPRRPLLHAKMPKHLSSMMDAAPIFLPNRSPRAIVGGIHYRFAASGRPSNNRSYLAIEPTPAMSASPAVKCPSLCLASTRAREATTAAI